MQPIIENFNKTVDDQEIWKFNLDAGGLYAIIVTARCQNWRQNLRRLFHDDDLALQIDDNLFGEISGKKKEFVGPGTWNGNELKNAKKTNVFILPLAPGERVLRFFTDGQPWVGSINVVEIKSEAGPIDLDHRYLSKAEGSRLFFDVVAKNIGFSGVTITASANRGDKLQLKINGQTAENKDSKRYKIWYWLGGKLKGAKKEFRKEYGNDNPARTLEFKGIGNPVIESISVSVKEVSGHKQARVVLYKDITLSDFVYLRSAPSASEGAELATLKNGDVAEVLEEVVVGKWVDSKSYIWHKVKFKNQVGYVLSSFVEMPGQERDAIIALIKYHAQKIGIEANLVVALAGCESRYKPYANGGASGNQETGSGIFQITPQLIKDLNDKSKNFYSPVSNVFDINDNVKAGVTFFRWLHNERYKDSADKIIKSVAAHNAGYPSVPVKGRLDLAKYQGQTKNLVSCVLKNSQQKQWHTIWWPKSLLVLVLSLSLITSALAYGNNYGNSPVVSPRSSDTSYHKPSSQKLNILWKYGSNILLFYNSTPELIFHLPISSLLGVDAPSNIDDDPARLVAVQGAVLDSGGRVFFLAALHSCGQNCNYTLYRVDAKTGSLTLIKTNLFGGEIRLFFSHDNQRLAIADSVEGGVCNTGAYIYIINTGSLAGVQIKGFDWPGSTAAYVQSASWKNNNEFQFSLLQGRCAGLHRGNRHSEYSYLINEQKLRLRKESFRSESRG